MFGFSELCLVFVGIARYVLSSTTNYPNSLASARHPNQTLARNLGMAKTLRYSGISQVFGGACVRCFRVILVVWGLSVQTASISVCTSTFTHICASASMSAFTATAQPLCPPPPQPLNLPVSSALVPLPLPLWTHPPPNIANTTLTPINTNDPKHLEHSHTNVS